LIKAPVLRSLQLRFCCFRNFASKLVKDAKGFVDKLARTDDEVSVRSRGSKDTKVFRDRRREDIIPSGQEVVLPFDSFCQ
jgi:hypothetical protein